MPDVSGVDTSGAGTPGISALVAASPDARGPFLPVKEYVQAFWADYGRLEVKTFDKLECGQHFQEPGFASWEAFHRGAWREAMDLLRGERPAITRQFDEAKERGLTMRRVRYVEVPPSDYLVWEMAVLRDRVSRGEQIRILVGQGQPSFQAPPPPLVFRACHSRDHRPVRTEVQTGRCDRRGVPV